MAVGSAREPVSDGAPQPEFGAREQALLELLESQRGRVVSRTELARAVGLPVMSRRLDVHLVGVRRAVGAARLTNVRSRGWMLND